MNKSIVKIIIRRILFSIVLIFLLVSFLFVLVRIAPGNPFQKYVSPQLNPELAKHVSESFNLNSSIVLQYYHFLTNLLSGDLGISYSHHAPVIKVISEYLPVTLLLTFVSIILQVFFAALIAIVINRHNLKRLSNLLLTFYTIPTFVFALFLVYIFSYKLSLFPSYGIGVYNFGENSIFENISGIIPHLVLPVISLSFAGTIYFYKYFSSELDTILKSNFVKKMKVEGSSNFKIYFLHVLPNAFIPIITLVGIEIGILLSGALITEVIFALPGMGRLTMDAILARDYPLIVGTVFCSAIFVVLFNLLADLTRASFDKRFADKLLK